MAIKDRDKDGDNEKGFLSRWSERKRSVLEDAAPEETAVLPADSQEAALQPAPDDAAAVDPADLPDVDSLEAGSDFTPFLKDGVPEALKRQALRRLWRLDPLFGHLDGLNDYDLDYTNAATVVEGLKTVYQVGKGMVTAEEEAAQEEEAAHKEEAGTAEDGGAAPDDAEKTPAQDAEVVETTSAEAAESAPAPVAEDAVAETKARRRNPGDPLVSGAPIRRHGTSRGPRRTASQRRWGDPDG